MDNDSAASVRPDPAVNDEQLCGTKKGLSLGPTVQPEAPVEQGHGTIVRILSINESIVRIYWENPSELDVKLKKSTRDKLLATHKGKFIVECKRRLEECATKGPPNHDETLQTDISGFIPADAMMILDDKESIDGFKANVVGLMEKNNFSAEYSSINGGDQYPLKHRTKAR